MFTERFKWLLLYKQRMVRLDKVLRTIAFSTHCIEAAHVTRILGMPVSHDTLLLDVSLFGQLTGIFHQNTDPVELYAMKITDDEGETLVYISDKSYKKSFVKFRKTLIIECNHYEAIDTRILPYERKRMCFTLRKIRRKK